MIRRLSFAEFVARRYADPLDILTEYMADAADKAALVGALFTKAPEFDRRRNYLPDLDGKHERKHYCRAGLDSDKDATWPCITFGTFKGAGGTVFWNPRNLVWNEFNKLNRALPDNEEYFSPEYRQRAAHQLSQQARREAERGAADECGRQGAAEVAAEIWDAGAPCEDHYYLAAKNVAPYGVRVATVDHRARLWSVERGEWRRLLAVRAGDLLVPMRDVEGKLWNVQRIERHPGSNGKHARWFLSGSRVRGLFHRIPGVGHAWIAEGYGTGATIHAATGAPVVVAFSAGNLSDVARALANEVRAVAADNDAKGAGQNGAERTGLPYIMPPTVGHDWNDHAAAYGLLSVAELLLGAIQ
jgi:putative DNA primase/helicase